MTNRTGVLGLLSIAAGHLAAAGTANAGVMGVARPDMMSTNSIIVFVVGVIVGGVIVYFWRGRR